MLSESIHHCRKRLLIFTGRDRPRQFWPWAGLVLGGSMVVWAMAFFAVLIPTFGKVQQFAREHPDQVTVDQGPTHYNVQVHGHHPELMPDFSNLFWLMAGLGLVVAVLLGAAVTRRLHDSNVRGWPALIPLALLLSGMALMVSLLGSVQDQGPPDMGRFMLLFVNNLAYLASLGGLVYLLVRKGTAGPNRFGEPPL